MISFGFSARHWQQIEAGRPITVTTLLRICEALEVNLVPILGEGIAGTWTLTLLNPAAYLASVFQNEQIQDFLFVITYNANTPAWPS